MFKGVQKEGRWVENPNEIKKEVKAFFGNRFKEVRGHRPTLDGARFSQILVGESNLVVASTTRI